MDTKKTRKKVHSLTFYSSSRYFCREHRKPQAILKAWYTVACATTGRFIWPLQVETVIHEPDILATHTSDIWNAIEGCPSVTVLIVRKTSRLAMSWKSKWNTSTSRRSVCRSAYRVTLDMCPSRKSPLDNSIGAKCVWCSPFRVDFACLYFCPTWQSM